MSLSICFSICEHIVPYLLFTSLHERVTMQLLFREDGELVRSVLHIGINACYTSIECLYDPPIRSLPVRWAGT